MYRFPLLQEGRPVGELTVRQEGEELVFSCRSRLPGDGLWSVWVVGERGELRLGMPTRQDDGAVLEKRFSRRMTEPVGQLLRGELRLPRQTCPARWHGMNSGCPFRTPWLARQLGNRQGVLYSRAGKGWLVAVPYEERQPFPLMPMFCFAALQCIDKRAYLVVRLDEEERPVF